MKAPPSLPDKGRGPSEEVSAMADSGSEQESFLSRLRLPAALLLAFLLIVGYYTLHYRANAGYLSSRNFRLLATLGKQVRDAVDNEGKVFANVAGWTGAIDPDLRPRIARSSCPDVKKLPAVPDQTTEKGKPKLWRMLSSYDGTFRLAFQSKTEGAAKAHCGEVELKSLLDPLFSSRKAFDAVLLADGDGKVVYLNSPKSLQVAQLDLLIQNRRSGQAAGGTGKAAGGTCKDGDFDAFRGYSRSAAVELGGRYYTVFVQPFSMSLPFGGADTTGKSTEKPHDLWLLAGLVADDEMAAKNLALSPSLVAFLLGILLLVALAWPLVKLKMLGEQQRVKKMDVLLVGLCSLLGVSIATLFVLDVGAYRTLKSASDVQLEDFAEQMESNLLVEIRRAYDQLGDLERRYKNIPLPAEGNVEADYPLTDYPYFESFSVIDGQGMQVFKRATPDNTPQRISVAERRYFRRVHNGRTLTVPELKEARDSEPFFLESVQSWTNGTWQAVISKPIGPWPPPTPLPKAQVAALAIRMLSVIDPVVPPDFELAVVGDDGTVLFHSDSARNGSEDFFEETDQDPRFRSLVLARHDEPLNLHYWGEDYRAFAIPVKGLPWTIVAMRKADVLDRMNLDWLVTTLILVLIYMSVITLALIAAALLRPKYLVTWIWPDVKRGHDYAKLLVLLGIFCLAFLIAIFVLPGTGYLFGAAVLLPALSLVAAYLVLSPVENRAASRGAAWACGVALLALLYLVLLNTPAESDVQRWVQWLVLALVVRASLLAFDRPERWRELLRRMDIPVSRSYPMLGLLLVLLMAVMTTIGFFKVAYRLQMNSFVRSGQLKMAKLLFEKPAPWDKKTSTDRASSASLTVKRDPMTNKPSLDFYGEAFFNTTVQDHNYCKLSDPDSCKGEDEPLAMLLPPYSAYTAEGRELLYSHTSDNDWCWYEENGEVFFDSPYLQASLHSVIEPVWNGNGLFLTMAGLLPPPEAKTNQLLEKTDRNPVTPSSLGAEVSKDTEGTGEETGKVILGRLPQVIQVILALLALSLFGTLLYALVTFLARRVFLIDVQQPLWTGRTGELPAMVYANVFLIGGPQSWKVRDEERFFSFSFHDLDSEKNAWSALRSKLGRAANRNVLLKGFEHRAFDPAWNARKLAVLEELVFVHQCVVVVLSELSPSLVFSPVGSAKDPAEDRWHTLLRSFVQLNGEVRPSSSTEEPEVWPSSSIEEPKLSSELLRKECGTDPFLLRIGRELDRDPTATPPDREQVLEELGERAHGYYSAIWVSCSRDEQVVLGHLAEEGLVNAKNRRIVRRLMARRLIHRAPNLCLMNETFRRFVASSHCREQVHTLEQAAGRSAWDRFHWPFSAALVTCTALILITQQELLDSTVAVVTGVTAGLAPLLKLIEQLGLKRAGKSV